METADVQLRKGEAYLFAKLTDNNFIESVVMYAKSLPELKKKIASTELELGRYAFVKMIGGPRTIRSVTRIEEEKAPGAKPKVPRPRKPKAEAQPPADTHPGNPLEIGAEEDVKVFG
jgi:hypothetical protein